ncbi:acyl transferase/acyl hydrolase/lysophospholipase [Coniochaeta sp. 2T2.1]|nr:acyl transferase/acyl hydrolase/lysophospholipase [Coniochaeta sp. 2T2.1]
MGDLVLHRLDTRPSDGRKPGDQTLICTSSSKSKQSTDHVLSRIIRGTNNLVLSLRDGLTELEREERRRTEERKAILRARIQNARTMHEWDAAARELDHIEGNDEWKADPTTGDYSPDLIEMRMRELDEARTNCDIRAMLYLVRTALSRDLGNMGNIDLYRHSYVGTKRLIERYVESAVSTIEALVEKSAYALPLGIGNKSLLEGVLYARQSFGRSALLLSGGATFGMAHIGVLKAMFEANLLPRIISGASAGSIVCSVLCCRTDDEIPAVLHRFPHGDLAVFDDESNEDGIADHIRRLLTEGSWSDIKRLIRVMRGMLGDITFQEAYNRTRRICNICVSSPSIYELPRLLNYVTAPNVMIWSAVAASCSVPLVFNAASLLVKDPATGAHMPWNPTPERWIDGSVDNDLPMTRLAEMFNVNHFIVSQVNPHVVPFLSRDDFLDPNKKYPDPQQSQSMGDATDWVQTLTTLAKDEAVHRLHFLTELGIFPNLCTKVRSVLSQRYSGDITILPEISPHDLPRILKNPTSEFMMRNCLVGERATWPKLSRIRDRLAIELALDRAVHALRTRVVFSKSQVDLRRLVTARDVAPPASAGSNAPLSRKTVAGASAPTDDDEADEEPYRRTRRGSGSSIQLMARQRLLHGQDHDEDSGKEEGRVLSVRRGARGMHLGVSGMINHTVNNTNNNKSKLKRSPNSHFHLSAKQLGPFTGPILYGRSAASAAPVFDFWKPATPPESVDFTPAGEGKGEQSPKEGLVDGDSSSPDAQTDD